MKTILYKKKYLIFFLIFVALFLIDRFNFMTDRLHHTWLHESGLYLGDPISFKQDMMLNKNEISFTKRELYKNKPLTESYRKDNFFLLGCYFGNLYLLNKRTHEIAIYSNKGDFSLF